VGDKVTYFLNAQNMDNAGSVTTPNTIIVTDVIPAGVSNVYAFGRDWNITLSATTHSTILTAVYQGEYPVMSGANLPAIIVRGQLMPVADPGLTTVATVGVPGDRNPLNNMAIDTVFVHQSACDDQRNGCGQRRQGSGNTGKYRGRGSEVAGQHGGRRPDDPEHKGRGSGDPEEHEPSLPSTSPASYPGLPNTGSDLLVDFNLIRKENLGPFH
jgi:uncharacterized repeat protein (TIGR01451 family)